MNRFMGETPFAGTFAEEWLPSVDVSETKDQLLIKAELPGLEAKDVNLSISGDVLIIKGEKKKEEEKKDEHYYHCEKVLRVFSAFIAASCQHTKR